MVRLRRTSASSPGWSRTRHGRGFRYLDQDGNPLQPEQVERCKKLVIPPAWTEVWICSVDNGHLQAVGTDDAGRRQYLYHPGWRERRDAEKFERMEDFASALLKRRGTARRDLAGDELDLRRVAAATFSLLDLGMFRIGSVRYAEENGSFGLTTLLKHHVVPGNDGLSFAYAAKSGQEVQVTVRDERVQTVLETLRRRRGGSDQLLAYRADGAWKDLDATDVNAYVKEVLRGDFTAKDFRTWRGTTIAALALAGSDGSTATKRKKSVAAAMREVSEHLGNTPAVARSSYVDPRVVDLFEHGVTVSADHRRVAPGAPTSRTLEREVLGLLGGA
ncbi:DNA topoisomerase IB [Aeromicrobium fastidiosum]|uniref:DNA topoisomerase IB n=1 Tax=Aeromicrobium fastidiosum TaxID=52699 RepID=A0A641ANN2_9ACTN|nr:DNA topoisomerase IB [Aeromicrobium fastidiosum]KAA1379696.1 DNA topoisomerase IB [Aeromicrobium fastidiosum]MBP2389177.1 DNA topoisomerase IB [Aeromicrobium fastidiosum]